MRCACLGEEAEGQLTSSWRIWTAMMRNRPQSLLNRAGADAVCVVMGKAGGGEPKEFVQVIQMSYHQDTEREKEESGTRGW